jgi:hypothetical protein
MTARQAARDAADSVLDPLVKDLTSKYSSPRLLFRDALRLAAAEAVEAATPFIAAAERERIIAAIDAEASRLGYDATEVYVVAWPHLAPFIADLLHSDLDQDTP